MVLPQKVQNRLSNHLLSCAVEVINITSNHKSYDNKDLKLIQPEERFSEDISERFLKYEENIRYEQSINQ